MSNLRICPINFFDEATISASPAMLASLPETNAQLTARDRVARSTSTADQVIQGNWGGNGRKIDSFFIFRHTGQGGRVRLQLFTDSAYTTQVYDSGTVDIYTLQGLDVDWGTAPLGFGANDLLAAEAPYSLFFTAVACSSFKMTFTRCQAAYWEFGRFFLGKYLEAPYNPQLGMEFGWQSNDLQTRTKGASLRTRPGERWRELKADMFYGTDPDRAIWRDLLGKISLNEDVAMSIFPGVGGRQERDHVMNAQLTAHSPFNWANVNFNETVFTFAEI